MRCLAGGEPPEADPGRRSFAAGGTGRRANGVAVAAGDARSGAAAIAPRASGYWLAFTR
jgi:hypothetical protein